MRYNAAMGLADRDYMRERVRRRVERERADEALIRWPPRPWVVITAATVLAMLVLVYVY
jgi:hypothetical protein